MKINIINQSPVIAIFILAALPVYFTFGLLPIWGDTFIYLGSEGLEKYLYQWHSLQNGRYFFLNYIPYYLYYTFIELFTDNFYYASSLILLILKITAGFGILKLSKLLYPDEKQYFYLIPVLCYLLSPAQLAGSYFLYIYSCTPWFIYFVYKSILHDTIKLSSLIWMTIILFFASVNLPNPKYIFHLILMSSLILLLAYIFGLLKRNFFKENIFKFVIFVILSLYLVVPQLVFIANYQANKYDVHIKKGYSDSGVMMDFRESTLPKMLRLHKDNLSLDNKLENEYNSSFTKIIFSYIFVGIIVGGVVFVRKKTGRKKLLYDWILLIILMIYLFFAVGPNPPFSFFYVNMVESFSLFAFLRTTSGTQYFLALLYSLLMFSFFLKIKNQNIKISVFVFLIIGITLLGKPFLNGETYKNEAVVHNYTDTSQHGIKIPDPYMKIKTKLGDIKQDVKVMYLEQGASYISNKWGYFGVSIYDFLFNTQNVDCINIKNHLKYYNIGYIVSDKSTVFSNDCKHLKYSKEDLFTEGFITLSKVVAEDFLPHFYTPDNVIFSDTQLVNDSDNPNIMRPVSLQGAISTLANSDGLIHQPTLTFVKVNPTKYKIKVENAANAFILIFSENYHQEWKLYVNDNEKMIETKLYDNIVATYFDEKIKEGRHINSFINNFIFETIWLEPIEDKKHFMSNGYSNAWYIDKNDYTQSNDFELIVEFRPQRYYYFSILISVFALALLILVILSRTIQNSLYSKNKEY